MMHKRQAKAQAYKRRGSGGLNLASRANERQRWLMMDAALGSRTTLSSSKGGLGAAQSPAISRDKNVLRLCNGAPVQGK